MSGKEVLRHEDKDVSEKIQQHRGILTRKDKSGTITHETDAVTRRVIVEAAAELPALKKG